MLFRYKFTIFYCIISEIKKRVILQQTIYMYILNNEEGEILLWGKGYYITRFPPGGKLLYSQFSGGKGYYGGKATIQQRHIHTDVKADWRSWIFKLLNACGENRGKQLALLNNRTTPLEDVNLSPVQLLAGRRLRNTLPAVTDILRPKNQNMDHIKRSLQSVKD